MFNFLSDKRRN